MNSISPTAATPGGTMAATAAADGSTLKVTAPQTIDPTNGAVTADRNPTLVWGNSEGKYDTVGLAYDIEVSTLDGTVVYARTVGESPSTGSHKVELTLPYATQHFWRARAHLNNMLGPWSGFAEFNTPKQAAPTSPTSPTAPSPTSPAPVDASKWTTDQWKTYFFELQAAKGTPTVSDAGMWAMRADLVARGADFQNAWRGDIRPRLFLPVPGCPPATSGNVPACSFNRPVDLGNYGGSWVWLVRF